jgi:unsaturated rhamnogalacturonyl hydrolase
MARPTGAQRNAVVCEAEILQKALFLLREQLSVQPRTQAGGFWHKKIYPYQMWLDGIYMAQPFYAAFAKTFNQPDCFDDIAHQILLIEEKAREPGSGLLYHAWDESKQIPWANAVTGCSPHFWGRAMGWYAMAIVDVLDDFPEDHPRRKAILEVFQRLAEAIARVQDPSSGVWYQVLDQGGREGNYLEASGSCMFVYAIAKGIRKGYLPAAFLPVVRTGYQGILHTFVSTDEQGLVTLGKVCGACGLGGVPYRDGSYEYYVTEKVVTNDYKGVGPFILASLEMEREG